MIQALIVTIFGGLGSVRGALVAGFVLRIFESFVEVYYGVAWAQPGVFLLIILMLILRPNGLFGIGEVRRLCARGPVLPSASRARRWTGPPRPGHRSYCGRA